MNYKFFQNKECEWFPCHSTQNLSKFSCLFCFCPLYPYKNCGGKYKVLKNGWKDCSKCLLPHYDYDYIIDKIRDDEGWNSISET